MSIAQLVEGLNGTPTIDAIKVSVAAQFGCTVREINGKRRERRVARPRQVAMYLSRSLTLSSSLTIGRAFGRDHSTVLHACRAVEELAEADERFRARLERLSSELEIAGNPARGTARPRGLEDVTLQAVRNSLLKAKAGGGAISGDRETLTLILGELFGEEPTFRMRGSDGFLSEILISPEGTWSRLDIQESRAALVAAGSGWRPI